jgi:hypothetical protein
VRLGCERKVSKLSFSGLCFRVGCGVEIALSFIRATAVSFLLIMSVFQMMANYERDEIYLAQWLERLTASAKVATVLG